MAMQAQVINHEVAMSQLTATLGSGPAIDRKSTRLNSSHTVISYAVFCLKKKKKKTLQNKRKIMMKDHKKIYDQPTIYIPNRYVKKVSVEITREVKDQSIKSEMRVSGRIV